MNEIISINLPLHVIIGSFTIIILICYGLIQNYLEIKNWADEHYIPFISAMFSTQCKVTVGAYLIACIFALIWGGFFWF